MTALTHKRVQDLFSDHFNLSVFSGSRVCVDGLWEWHLAGVCPVDERNVVELVVAATPPRPIQKLSWWSRLWSRSTVTDNDELEAEHAFRSHLWLIRCQCVALLDMQPELTRRKFRAVRLVEEALKEARSDLDDS